MFDLTPLLKAVLPADALAFFRQKGYRINFDLQDMRAQENQAAFTVAKVMQLDLLADIRTFVDAAIADGTTLAQFRKLLTPRLQDAGWWGRKVMTDPDTGEIRPVQLGSPRRLEIIYDTNLATAYSEGQWERIQRGKTLFPFLEYLHTSSNHPDPTHLTYVGFVGPVDDPFWQAHMPVRKWNCKCQVVQHNQRSLDREGLAVTQAPPEVMRQVVNRRTGEIMDVPAGVDPEFNYPPGGRRANLDKLLQSKLPPQS